MSEEAERNGNPLKLVEDLASEDCLGTVHTAQHSYDYYLV